MKGTYLQQDKQAMQLSRYNNQWYNPGPGWKRAVWYVANTIFFNNSFAVFNGLKCFLLRLFGAIVGERGTIKPSVNIKYPWLLKNGNDVWIGERVWIDNLGIVSIANDVCISQGTLLLTGNHNYKKRFFDLIIGKITIEDGVWIGANCTICPDVTCKTHSVLSVGSVATNDLEPYTVYQGVPAEKIRIRIIN